MLSTAKYLDCGGWSLEGETFDDIGAIISIVSNFDGLLNVVKLTTKSLEETWVAIR